MKTYNYSPKDKDEENEAKTEDSNPLVGSFEVDIDGEKEIYDGGSLIHVDPITFDKLYPKNKEKNKVINKDNPEKIINSISNVYPLFGDATGNHSKIDIKDAEMVLEVPSQDNSEAEPTSQITDNPIVRIGEALSMLNQAGVPLQNIDAQSAVSGLIDDLAGIAPKESLILKIIFCELERFNALLRDDNQEDLLKSGYLDVAGIMETMREDILALIKTEERDGSKVEALKEKARLFVREKRFGTLDERYNKIQTLGQNAYQQTQKQVVRERAVLNAYHQFQMAMRLGVYLIQQVQEKALEIHKEEQRKLIEAQNKLNQFNQEQRFTLPYMGAEIQRDDALHNTQRAESRLHGLTDLLFNLRQGLTVGQTIKLRQGQVTEAKEHLWRNLSNFMGMNGYLFTGLQSTLKATVQLNQTTRALESLAGVNDKTASLLAETGNEAQMRALKASKTPGIRAETAKKLLTSMTEYMENSKKYLQQIQQVRIVDDNLQHQQVEEHTRVLVAKTSGLLENQEQNNSIIIKTNNGMTTTSVNQNETVIVPSSNIITSSSSNATWMGSGSETMKKEEEDNSPSGLVKKALEKGLNKNLLLFAEINKGKQEYIEALLDVGANPFERLGNKTALELFIQKNENHLKEIFAQESYKETPISKNLIGMIGNIKYFEKDGKIEIRKHEEQPLIKMIVATFILFNCCHENHQRMIKEKIFSVIPEGFLNKEIFKKIISQNPSLKTEKCFLTQELSFLIQNIEKKNQQ